MPVKEHLTQISNVLVIGCGGAGLRSAIEIKKSGLDVCILGKRPKTDSHTVLAAGGINAALGNLDKEDSWKQHFIDTYLDDLFLLKSSIKNKFLQKGKKFIDKFDDMKNIASNRLEDWLEEDEDINQNLDFKQKSFYNNDRSSIPSSEKKEDDPWI